MKEIMEKLEELTLENIEKLKKKTMPNETQAMLHEEIMDCIEMINKIYKDCAEITNKQAQMEIEREKMKNSIEKEMEEKKMFWKNAAIDIGKTCITVVLPLIAYSAFQKRIIKFEETGRLCSWTAKELHMPKLFNK